MMEERREIIVAVQYDGCRLDHFLHQLYIKVREKNLIIGACKACSTKLGVADAVKAEGVELIGSMAGHPAVGEYLREGYTVLTF